MRNLLKQLQYKWRLEEILFQKGLSIENIHSLEKKLGYFFPQEFVSYLETVNGMEEGEADQDLFYFWGSELIEKEFFAVKPAAPDSIFIGFADRIVIDSVYMIEVSKTRQTSGRIAVQKKDTKIISPSFYSFLNSYLNSLGNQLPNWEQAFSKDNQLSPFTLLCQQFLPGKLASFYHRV